MNAKIIKYTYVSLLFILIIAAIVFAVISYWDGEKPTNNIQTGNGGSNTTNPTVQLGNLDEILDNLRKSSKLLYQNESGNGYVLKEDEDYAILMFDEKETSFLISINVLDDIPETRSKAEKVFLEILKVDEKTACGLTVSMGIPKEASATQIGVDYGLSFCPNWVQFEP